MPLGAYFGSNRIVQGAGGLGDAPLQAFADGVVGGSSLSPDMPGPLLAYSDGSLGAAPLQAFADGVVGGSAANPDMPGSLFSYEDGVLGPHFSGMQFSDAGGGVGPGSGGGGGGGGGSESMADMPLPVLAYQDGVFGGRGCAGLGDDDPGGTPISVYQDGIFDFGDRNANFGPLQSYRDGSLGRMRHFSGMGADAAPVAPPALDLGDEETLMEVKGLIGIMSAEQTATEAGQKAYPPEF